MSRKKLTQTELQAIVGNLELEEDSWSESCGSSDDYEPDSTDESISDEPKAIKKGTKDKHKNKQVIAPEIDSENEEEKENNENDSDSADLPDSTHLSTSNTSSFVLWSEPDDDFVPKKEIPTEWSCKISPDIKKGQTPLQIFQKLFPPSLFMYIAQCTNERIQMLSVENKNKKRKREKKGKEYENTSSGEIKKLMGCMLIMSYNHVPSISNYWSTHPSLGNQSIKKAFSRDRFQLLFSKMYFASPQKPDHCSKTYYIDDVAQCLKERFRKARQDSCCQSIDESMTKFKGRSALKQYMPLKPVKRGIKMWLRCDSYTGYTYDFNIYTGRETEQTEGTLGERVVTALSSTISEKNVALCFDRFFTSVNLLKTLDYPALGTCISNRKNLPKIDKKLSRGESVFRACKEGLLYTKWQDTKEVYLLSNCHKYTTTTVKKTQKDGSKIDVSCPEMVSFYRKIMGGVDLADQMMGVYEMDRKSKKWWKKVFCRMMMMTIVNAWIISSEVNKKKFLFFSLS